jgi:hypothetical protein
LGKSDQVFFYVKQFYEKSLLSGAPSEQVFCDFLPADPSVIDIDSMDVEPVYDVGFVKTMSATGEFRDFIDKEVYTSWREDDRETSINEISKVITEKVEKEELISFQDCLELGPVELGLAIVNYYHHLMSLKMVNCLHEEQFSLALTGANWGMFSHLQKHACGHAESRFEYERRFLENRINLSINPLSCFHPRIFQGGQLGAFFLVHYVPESIVWCSMPDDLQAGEHFDYFSSREELLEKCRYYLDRPELRKTIGLNLREVIEEKYHYKAFCTNLVERFQTGFTKQLG